MKTVERAARTPSSYRERSHALARNCRAVSWVGALVGILLIVFGLIALYETTSSFTVWWSAVNNAVYFELLEVVVIGVGVVVGIWA